MSRKRASSTSATALVHRNDVQCPNVEEYEYEYYRPGCYCTPQVVRHATPYTCAYLHEYLPQWSSVCNPATYVVDNCGMVYYLSDFEYQLQLPNGLDIETEFTYHYFDKNENACAADEEEEAVSPRKRERFECDDTEEEVIGVPHRSSETGQKTDAPVAKSTNVYRSEQGYLVEEPSEDADVKQPK